MASVPALRTWVPGEMASAALLNTHIRGTGSFFLKTPWVYLTRTAGQTISNTTLTGAVWNVPIVDTDNFHPGNSATVTIKQPGYYALHATTAWSANNIGTRVVRIDRNGSLIMQSGCYASYGGSQSFPSKPSGQWLDAETAVSVGDPGVPLQVGDTLVVQTYQDSGSSLTLLADYTGGTPSVISFFSARWVASL